MQLGGFKRFVGLVRKGKLQYRFYVQMKGSKHTYLWTHPWMQRKVDKPNARYQQ